MLKCIHENFMCLYATAVCMGIERKKTGGWGSFGEGTIFEPGSILKQ